MAFTGATSPSPPTQKRHQAFELVREHRLVSRKTNAKAGTQGVVQPSTYSSKSNPPPDARVMGLPLATRCLRGMPVADGELFAVCPQKGLEEKCAASDSPGQVERLFELPIARREQTPPWFPAESVRTPEREKMGHTNAW